VNHFRVIATFCNNLRRDPLPRVYCMRNSEVMVLFISKEYLERNITFFQCVPQIISPISVYRKRNTMVCGTLFSGGLRISPSLVENKLKNKHFNNQYLVVDATVDNCRALKITVLRISYLSRQRHTVYMHTGIYCN
jgi:hypothetical protein